MPGGYPFWLRVRLIQSLPVRKTTERLRERANLPLVLVGKPHPPAAGRGQPPGVLQKRQRHAVFHVHDAAAFLRQP